MAGNCLGYVTQEERNEVLLNQKQEHVKKSVVKHCAYSIPKRLWENLVLDAVNQKDKDWADLNKQEFGKLIENLISCTIEVKGKSTFKDEFVTAGGVKLSEINFKSFSSKLHDKLYFAGEVLNIDAITGGFNFQAAWTGSWIIAQHIK